MESSPLGSLRVVRLRTGHRMVFKKQLFKIFSLIYFVSTHLASVIIIVLLLILPNVLHLQVYNPTFIVCCIFVYLILSVLPM
jgi:hypothetical protein